MPLSCDSGPIAALNSQKMIAAICEAGAFGMLALGFSNPMRQSVWSVRSGR